MTPAGPDVPPTIALTTGDPAEVDALTADGGIVTIRPVRADDRRGLAALYAEASPERLRLRFFARPSSDTLTAEVDRLCRPQDDRHVAVVAGTPVGVASCERTSGTDRRAEFSILVADQHRGRGLGTLLLEHLGARAHAHGITELIGEILPGNMRMLRMARDLSGRIRSRFDDGIVDVGLHTDTDESVQLAVDVRDRVAERASLRPLLSPPRSRSWEPDTARAAWATRPCSRSATTATPATCTRSTGPGPRWVASPATAACATCRPPSICWSSRSPPTR